MHDMIRMCPIEREQTPARRRQGRLEVPVLRRNEKTNDIYYLLNHRVSVKHWMPGIYSRNKAEDGHQSPSGKLNFDLNNDCFLYNSWYCESIFREWSRFI